MNRLTLFWRSAIGKKVVMAATGIIGIGFVIAHVTGNLLVFKGPAAMNAYSAFLHGPAAELLWVMRVILLAAVVLHVIAAAQLTVMSRAARPVGYQQREPQVSTIASRVMRVGGVLLLAFIIFHILHFTTGTIRPGTYVPGDVYTDVITSFHVWWVALFYLVAMAFLGLHLYHGAWSSFRTLGASGRSPQPLHRRVAALVALCVWAGFSIIPFAVWAGLIQ